MIAKALVACACLLAALHVGSAKIYRSNYIGALNIGLKMRQHLTGVEHKGDQPEYQYFTQQLDHFDSQNNKTWTQRYLINTTNWQGYNAPVFFVLGGEGEMGRDYVTGHFVSNLWAETFGGLVVALEHRFYGKSIPTSDSSTPNLRWLSSQQALADAANFRQFIATAYNATGPWIIVGGSYSGNLAAWLKLKYPNLFAGSIAASAPVRAELDFSQYLEVVTASVGPTCAARFAAASDTIEQLILNAAGWGQLSAQFNTCAPISSLNDVKMFVQSILDGPSGVVQYNADNNNYEPFQIPYMCSIMAQGSDPLAAWANLTAIFQNGTCLDVSYSDFVQSMATTSDGRSWTYQTCREFGYYQACDGLNQPFPRVLDVQFSNQICNDLFGEPFIPAINWTNTYYGGVDIEVSNTFMANGLVDPWHTLGTCYPQQLGPGRDVGPGSTTWLMYGTAHCADLYPPRDDDVPDLKLVQELQMISIKQWISQ